MSARNSRWKHTEVKIAEALGGKRVPITGRTRGSAPDVEHEWLSIEVKDRAALPTYLRARVEELAAERDALRKRVAELEAADAERRERELELLNFVRSVSTYREGAWDYDDDCYGQDQRRVFADDEEWERLESWAREVLSRIEHSEAADLLADRIEPEPEEGGE